MRLHKFIFIAFIATVLALGYVHQQIEIVKAGYNVQQTVRKVSRLSEENTKLRYDLSRVGSPKNLLASIDDSSMRFARRRGFSGERIATSTVYRSPRPGLIGRFVDLITPEAVAASQR